MIKESSNFKNSILYSLPFFITDLIECLNLSFIFLLLEFSC